MDIEIKKLSAHVDVLEGEIKNILKLVEIQKEMIDGLADRLDLMEAFPSTGKGSWIDQAIYMKRKGHTNPEISKVTGKSLATIQRYMVKPEIKEQWSKKG